MYKGLVAAGLVKVGLREKCGVEAAVLRSASY